VNTAVPPGVRPPLPGDPESIGPYPVLGRLGAGGMGVVYLARSPSGELVAVKTLRAADPEARTRFQSEVLYGRRASSVWTPTVLADGTDAEQPYIVTEYIAGPSLSEWVLTQGPLDGDTLIAVGLGTAAALAAIHRADLLHRDLKPANVLLSPDGPRIIDFGIASDAEPATGLTQQGMVMGSPGWVAPERMAGGPATVATDVFSWGCVVAFAGLGRHPFNNGQAADILTGYPELSGLEEPMRGLVHMALSREPETRPDSAVLLERLLATAREHHSPRFGFTLLPGWGESPPQTATGEAAAIVEALWTARPDFQLVPPAPPAQRGRVARYRLATFAVAGALGAGVATLALTPSRGDPSSTTVEPSSPRPTAARTVQSRATAPHPASPRTSPTRPGASQSPLPSPTATTVPVAQPTPTTSKPAPAPTSATPTPTPTPTTTSATPAKPCKGRKNPHCPRS
jgi:serine/threonine protein kinase